ncbi:MAG TPA: hypothetical protein VFP33_12435 [Gallionella sp.]|nr:hypothetical protein [Gallionella sp.]
MTVLDRYFELSDSAGNDQATFQKLIDCFSANASVKPARGDELRGKQEIEKFYREFFLRSKDLRHIWNVSQTNGDLKADWAVVGRRPDGGLFAFLGEDVAETDELGKIKKLVIQFK